MGQSQQYEIGFTFPNEINQNAPFIVRTLKIDNPGGNWLYQPESQQFVGPFTLGAYLAITLPTNQVHIRVQAPTGRNSYSSGTNATVTAMEDAIASSAGFGIPDPTAPLAFNQRTFTVTSANVNTALGFTAHAAIINNSQGRWLFFPDTGTYVPPYTQGVVIAFPVGVTTAVITADATAIPAGQFNPGGGSAATVVYVDGNLTPSGGTSIILTNLDLASQSSTFTVTTVNVSTALGFTAHSATVDNPGGRWLTVGNETIPPWSTGAIVNFPIGVTTAVITVFTPTGQANTQAGNAAKIVYYDTNLGSSPPVPIGQNLNQGGGAFPGVISVIGPAIAGTTFGATGATPTNGVPFRLAWLQIAAVPANTGLQAIPVQLRFGFGTAVGVGTVLWQGLASTGSGGSSTAPGAPNTPIPIIFPVDARPAFTGVTGSTLWADVTSINGGLIGANTLQIEAFSSYVPVPL